MSGLRFSLEQLRPEMRAQVEQSLRAIKATSAVRTVAAGKPTKKPPKETSHGEAAFGLQLMASKITGFKRNFVFHPVRRWRFDFAWPDKKIAFEIEGGTWVQGRHSRGGGFAEDCLKYNTATEMGWRVYRVTTEMVTAGIAIKLAIRVLQQ